MCDQNQVGDFDFVFKPHLFQLALNDRSCLLYESGTSSISGTIDKIQDIYAPPLRLYDNYLTAFHRVVEVCLEEISTRVTTDIPQNDDFLLNFVMWEQSLRRNLNADLWAQNPSELIGNWEFLDVKGSGSLDAIIFSNSKSKRMNNEQSAETDDGEVQHRAVLVYL